MLFRSVSVVLDKARSSVPVWSNVSFTLIEMLHIGGTY